MVNKTISFFEFARAFSCYLTNLRFMIIAWFLINLTSVSRRSQAIKHWGGARLLKYVAVICQKGKSISSLLINSSHLINLGHGTFKRPF